MKTFKLVSLHIEVEDHLEEIELIDGLIISQENSKRTWVIEAYCSEKYLPFFQNQLYDGKILDAHVVITKPENNPATFETRIISIRQLDQGISVLLQGIMRQNNNDYAEKILSQLVKQNLSGEELLKAFHQNIKTKRLK